MVVFRLLKRGGFDHEKTSASQHLGIVAHVLVIIASLLAVQVSTVCGGRFEMRQPSVLYFRLWLEVHDGLLLIGVHNPR